MVALVRRSGFWHVVQYLLALLRLRFFPQMSLRLPLFPSRRAPA